MKKIKDFFHDSNDLLLALLIILVAAGVIVWRIGVILDYPSKYVKENAQKVEQVDDKEKTDKANDKDKAESADSTEDKGASEAEKSDDASAGSGDGSSPENAVG